MKDDNYIRFDWAIKRLLRDKANFGVLEGYAQGLAQAKRKLVATMKQNGVSQAIISQDTGLSINEIEQLKIQY